MTFVHLHAHSYYSIGIGYASPAALARAAAERGMAGLALTDRDSAAGLVEHVRACREAGVRPIVGAEISLQDPRMAGGRAPGVHHLTVLVQNQAGYRNLVRLLNSMPSGGGATGQRAVSFMDFAACARGLLVLTGGPEGRLFEAAEAKQLAEAQHYLRALNRAAGPENVFVEIQAPASPGHEAANRRLLELADHEKATAVATQDIHYLRKSDHLAAFVTQYIGHGSQADWERWVASQPRRHFASAEEMRAHFAWRPELLEASGAVAGRCRFEMPVATQHFPTHMLGPRGDAETALWERVAEGLRRQGKAPDERVKERVDREIAQIREKGLGPYFLLLCGLAAELDREHIPRGPARSIWQRSAVAYALGLTFLDPTAYRLEEPVWAEEGEAFPLWRFELAEADIPRALRLFATSAGAGRMARAGAYQRRHRASLLRDLCRWTGASGTKLARLLSERPPERKRRVKGAEKSGNGNGHGSDEGLRIDDAVFLRRAADLLAERPEALRADGAIAVFSGVDLQDIVPLAELPEAGRATQMESSSLDALGLPQAGLFSTAMADVFAIALRHIRQQHDPEFRLDAIPHGDAEAFALLAQGQTNGFTDLHSITAKALLRASPPKTLIDVAGAIRAAKRESEGALETGAGLGAVLPAALAAYWAAWLKRRYPLAFMAAMLTRHLGNPKRFAILMREARRMRLPLLPPDINLSHYEFAPEKGAIRAGLALVRHFGQRAYAETDRERKSRPFDDLVDLCRRTDPHVLNKRTLLNLIKAGALDRFGLPRSHHWTLLEEIFRDIKAERRHEEPAGQLTLFDLDELERKEPGDSVSLEDLPEFSPEQKLVYERDALGFLTSADPLDFYRAITAQLKAIGPFDLRKRHAETDVFVVGYIDHVERAGFLVGGDVVAALDCEGAVVRVARGARSQIGESLECPGPVLIGGIARRNKQEVYLEAHAIYALDEVLRLAQQVAQIEIDPGPLHGDRKAARNAAALIKAYRGTTQIVLSAGPPPGTARWTKLEGVKTLFCPPLYLGLCQIVGAERIRLLDKEGCAIEIPAPAILT